MLFAVLHFGKWFSKTRFRAGKFPSFLRFLIAIYLTQTFDIEFVFGDWLNIFATYTSTSWIKIATDQCWRGLDQGSTDQSQLVLDRAVRSWSGPSSKTEYSRTVPDHDWKSFRNLGPDQDQEKFSNLRLDRTMNEKSFKARDWIGPGPRKISKSRTGTNLDQPIFKNLGPILGGPWIPGLDFTFLLYMKIESAWHIVE